MSLIPSHSHRANHRAQVISIKEVALAHYQLRLKVPELAEVARPGQFVHILTTPNANDWTFDPLLRRAFSIMSVEMPQKTCIDVLFRAEGRGTRALAKACEGDEIDLIGPLGQPFDVTPFGITRDEAEADMFHVKQNAPSAIVVGGGVGVPPLIYLSEMLESVGINVQAIIGARSSSDVIGWHELSAVCQNVSVTTDDGSRGHHGRVTDLLDPLLSSSEKQHALNPIVYACGPLPMLRAVARLCGECQIRCQVSLEENMPCGIGVCNGCVVRTSQPQVESDSSLDINQVVGNEWSPYRAYRRVCVEGPACWADEIDWEHQG